MVFLPIASNAAFTTGLVCYPVVIAHNSEVQPVLDAPINGVLMEDRMRRLEANPQRAASLAKARSRLGKWLTSEPEATATSRLAGLRLRAGLSQAQLAATLGTSQPTIARMERGTGNHTMDVLRAWAKALGVTQNELFDAFDTVASHNSESSE